MPETCLDFAQHSQALRREIDAALDDYAQFDSGCPDRLRNAIRHSLLSPGKRLRPQLVLMACEACGCYYAKAMPAACAVEMIHTYSLIHDDLPAMDDDDMRRGLPSCHAKFGEATAILAGDALLAQAFETLARGIQPPEATAQCCAELAAAAGASALVGGQSDDLAVESGERGLEQITAIHERKTGALFRVSLRLGGLVAESSGEQLLALDTYGMNLGLAFQITDDLLDLNGDENEMGKRTQKDAARGKITFPGLIGIAESQRRAQEFIDRACAALVDFGERASHLRALARVVIERDR